MTLETLIAPYLVIGLLYVVVNGAIRNLYDQDDWLLVLAHIFLWWLFLLGLVIDTSFKLVKRWTGKS